MEFKSVFRLLHISWRRDWDSNFNLNSLKEMAPYAGDFARDLKAVLASVSQYKIFVCNYIYVDSTEPYWCRQLGINLRIIIAVFQYLQVLHDGAMLMIPPQIPPMLHVFIFAKSVSKIQTCWAVHK